ncbi:MAG: hypothetical protein Q9169_002762 [Polycauliona sp. 2 TL-2023]
MSSTRVSFPQPKRRVAEEVYQRALETYKASLSAKEYAKITVPTRIESVLDTVDSIKARHKTSKTVRLCESLDISSASINFVFIVGADSAETFAKCLDVLVTTAEKMPQFEILADTFAGSEFVMDSVESLYVAIINFWVEAAKFYRKKRVWRLPLCNDYAILLKDLVNELNEHERRLRGTAQIQHMQEAKEDRVENREFRRQGTFARTTTTKIIKWLSSADNYEVQFFKVDFQKAGKKRHRGTCEWILRKPAYIAWVATPQDKGALHVISGNPGAGTTVLSSFSVAHCIHRIPPGSRRIGLYLYFDNKDEHKRSPLSAARSLVYQLYTSLRERGQDTLISQELEMRMQSSASERAMNYERLWAILRPVTSMEGYEIVITLDAMDECNESKPFIRDLKKLVAVAPVRVLITSRNNTLAVPVFSEGNGVPTHYMTTDDVKRDIVSFLQAKVDKSATLQHPQVKDKVVTALATKSGGMFLWVYLMLKVLKHLPTVANIIHALSSLPENLDDVYERILLQLQTSLKPGPRGFCQLVLKWIVSTRRYWPAIDAEEGSPNGEWAVRSVAVRPGGSHIAVVFCPTGTKGISSESFYRNVVWLNKDPSKQTGTDDWTERILIDITVTNIFRCAVADSYITQGRGNVVSFPANFFNTNTMSTCNISTEERADSLGEIYQPSGRIIATSFNSQRVARIRDLTELEILLLQEQPIGNFSFPGSEVLHICTTGYTGQKIVLTYCDVTKRKDLRRIVCVHVPTKEVIRLHSRAVSRINFPRFIIDEQRFVGRISCNLDHSGSEIAIWNVLTGDVAYLYKDPDAQLSFCLHQDDIKAWKVTVVSSNGQTRTKDITEHWTPNEGAKFQLENVATPEGSGITNTSWAKLLWRIVGDSEIRL